MGNRGKRIRLGPRDREILQFTGEQVMTWLEPLHQKFYRDRDVNAVKSTVRRLKGHPPRYRYLRPDFLDEKRSCLRLTNLAARMLGFSPNVTRPLGSTTLTL